MKTYRRRSVIAACTALATAGGLASLGTTSATERDAEFSETISTGDPDGWSSYRGNAGNTRYLPLEGEFPAPDAVAWRYENAGEMAIVDGRVYVRTGSEVHALDAEDGDLLWRNTDIDARGTPAVFDDAVYVSEPDRVTALDTDDGTVQWETEFDTEELVPNPTVALETIFVVANGTLYALDVADGAIRWSSETIRVQSDPAEGVDPVPVSFRPETVAVANGSVYAMAETASRNDGGAIGAVDATTGDTQWGIEVSDRLTTPIVATANRLFVNRNGNENEEGNVHFDLVTGDGNGERVPVVAAGTDDITITVADGTLSAIDTNGDVDWSVSSGPTAWRTPIIAGDTVIVGHYTDTSEEFDFPSDSIIGFDLADGSEKWVLEFEDGQDPYADIAASEDTLYIQREGAIVAIRPSRDDDSETGDEPDGDEEPDGDDREARDATEDGDEDDTDATGQTDEDGTDAESGDTGGTEAPNPDEGGGESGDDRDDTGSDGQENPIESEDELEDVPGFTPGVSIAGGVLTLEWLRRRAGTDEPDD